jgi:hypothetical protein
MGALAGTDDVVLCIVGALNADKSGACCSSLLVCFQPTIERDGDEDSSSCSCKMVFDA